MRRAKNRMNNRKGAAAVELALVAPVLCLLLAGTSDVVGFYRAQLRVETASVQIAQIVSQCTQITNNGASGDTEEFFAYGQSIVGNLVDLRTTNGPGAIIISAIGMVNNVPKVRWQVRSGNTNQTSSFGLVNGNAAISGNMTFNNTQTLFAVEVYGSLNNAYVLSSRMMGSVLGRLQGIALLASRAPSPASLQTPPSTSASPAKVCTA